MAFYKLASGLMTSSMVTAASEKVSFDQLLEMFKDSEKLATMANSDKMIVTLFVAALGMGVTFSVLLFLWFCISAVTKIIGSAQKAGSSKEKITEVTPVTKVQSLEEVDEDEELVAVISAAIAASMNTSIHSIVVKNIVKVSDHSPSWSKTGRIEQMNTRF